MNITLIQFKTIAKKITTDAKELFGATNMKHSFVLGSMAKALGYESYNAIMPQFKDDAIQTEEISERKEMFTLHGNYTNKHPDTDDFIYVENMCIGVFNTKSEAEDFIPVFKQYEAECKDIQNESEKRVKGLYAEFSSKGEDVSAKAYFAKIKKAQQDFFDTIKAKAEQEGLPPLYGDTIDPDKAFKLEVLPTVFSPKVDPIIVLGKCPECGGRVLDKKDSLLYVCENAVDCSFTQSKHVDSKRISFHIPPESMRALLEGENVWTDIHFKERDRTINTEICLSMGEVGDGKEEAQISLIMG